ncbi:FAD-dependent oxidoreductase, partial [Candidatus Bathyarchaeota archaeon]|nr:FAD-dependent oxidoreductase [Candidatus Bathyarchaeota archaeon]
MNVQGYVALIAQRKFKEGLELIRRDMPLPAVCGRVCFHPCEKECERGEVDQPLAINALKRFVADYELEQTTKPLSPSSPLPLTHNEKVAIVGSGPTGLTAAFELRKKGYPVTVFESLPRPGGMLRVGVPEYRLPRDVLDAEIEHIKDLGVEIRTNVSIGKDLMFNELLQESGAVFIATGMHKGAKLGIDGEELNGVVNAIDFLREVNLGKKVELGDRVAVICVHRLLSLETARVALRLGPKEVNVIYRRSRKSMLYHERIQERMQKEVEEAEREGAKIHFMISPTKILGKDGRVVGIECARMILGEPDNSGRRQLVPIKGSEFIIELDAVILAVGQAPDFSFLPREVELTEKNTIKVDPVTLETSLPGVFAGGEVESGPSTAIASIAAGKRAAVSIDRYLRGENLKVGKEEEIKLVKEVSKEGVEKKARQVMPLLPVEKRIGGFKEVETGFTEEMALREAERCLNCGGCSECLECEKACELRGTIIHRQRPERIKINVGAIILAPGFEEFDPCLKKEYGHGRYLNVVSSIEFERILNASGPFGGKILRPFDDKIPRKIAFIQCVGSRDAQLGNNYCSAACCMYGIKEAVVAKEHTPTKLDCTIFYMDMRSYGKEFDAYRDRAREEYGVRFVRSRVAGVAEDPLTGNLFVHYVEDETPQIEEFDMVVLSVGMQPPRNAERLAEILGIKLNKYKFCETDAFSPLETSRPGVFVCGAFAEPKDIPESVAQASGAASKAMGIIATERGKLVTVKEFPPERDVSQEEPRIGVFVCHCGINIGAIVNVPEVVEYAKKLPNVVYSEENLYTCSQDTQKLIIEKIQQHNLNRVVVASCTPRTHEPLFRETVQEAGLNPYLFEMANIRDQCS